MNLLGDVHIIDNDETQEEPPILQPYYEKQVDERHNAKFHPLVGKEFFHFGMMIT
jgi:hypothetical protein